jgi:hypothetical protein
MQSRWRLIIKLQKRCRMKTGGSDDVRSGLPFRALYAQRSLPAIGAVQPSFSAKSIARAASATSDW